MEGQVRKYGQQHRQLSPDRAKVWKERSPKYQQWQPEKETELQQKNQKVPVVYHLCRNRQLEHPHFIEVPLASSEGEHFAMVSGTSMAAPHITGIAALIKQKHPHWSPAAIKSGLMTSSNTLDRAEKPILAEQYSGSETMTFVPTTPFDYESGHVNPRAALDPGLVFDAGYEDYLGFLCTTPGIDHHELLNYTHHLCNYTLGHPYNLNSPSITVSHLVRTQTVTRTVANVDETETYTITTKMAPAIAIETRPRSMTLRPGASRKLTITLTVRSVTKSYSFGEVLLKGNRGHKVRIPVAAMGYNR